MNHNTYDIEKRPCTWRVRCWLNGSYDYVRCDSIAEVRVAVANARANGFVRSRRYVPQHIADAREIKRISDGIGDWDGRRRLDEHLAGVISELKRMPPLDADDATEGWCQVTAARSIARILLRSLNVDGLGGCRLCCS